MVALALGLAGPACKHQDPVVIESAAMQPVQAEPPRQLQIQTTVEPLPPPPPIIKTTEATVKPDELPGHVAPRIMLAPAQRQQPVSNTPRSQVLQAIEHALSQRRDEAVAAIKHLPADDQDRMLFAMSLLLGLQNGELWPELTGPQKQAFLLALRNLDKRLSKSAELRMRRLSYIEEVRGVTFGEVEPRNNTTFFPEDYVKLYAELINLVDVAGPDGLFNVHIYTTIEIRSEDNQVHFSDRKPSKRRGSISSRNDYFICAYFDLPRALAPGHYQLVVKVEDLDTSRTATQNLPLHVIDRPRVKRGK
jgi:hypothetical protein